MFKKKFKVSAQNLISGKDRKSIKSNLLQHFQPQAIEHFFLKTDKILCLKLQGSKSLIYCQDDMPVFVDGTGKLDFFPTSKLIQSVYFCHIYPNSFPQIILNEGVESFILKGANLMWPGVKSHNLGANFQKDSVVVIMSNKMQLIGVGAMACNSKQIKKDSKQQEGIACILLHFLGDAIWKYGDEEIPKSRLMKVKEQRKEQVQVKKSKKNKKVFEEQEQVEQKQQIKEVQVVQQKEQKKSKKKKNKNKMQQQEQDNNIFGYHKEESDDDEQLPNIQIVAKKKGNKLQLLEESDQQKGKKKKNKNKNQDQKKKKKNKQQQEQNKGKKKRRRKHSSDQEQQKKQQESKESIPPHLMDEYLKQAFLNALKINFDEKKLPVDGGTFFIENMLKAKKPDCIIDVKRSTFKQMNKFYQQMDNEGLIEFKPTKNKKSYQITKIIWRNKQQLKIIRLQEWQPTISKVQEKVVQQTIEQIEQKNLFKEVEIIQLYKPPQKLYPIFYPKPQNLNDPDAYIQSLQEQIKQKEYYKQEQIPPTLNKYLDRINIEKNKKMVFLNIKHQNLICQLYHKQIEAKIEQQQQQILEQQQLEEKKKKNTQKDILKIQIDQLAKKIEDIMIPSYSVYYPQLKDRTIKNGKFKGITILSQKVHNKNVTKVTGLQMFMRQFSVVMDQKEKNIYAKRQRQKQLQKYDFLSNKFQTMFACAISLHEISNKSGGKVRQFQLVNMRSWFFLK